MIKLNKKDKLKSITDKDIPCWLQGLIPEAKAYGVFLLWKRLKSACLYLLAREDDAEKVYEGLKVFLPEKTFLIPVKDRAAPGSIYQLLNCVGKGKDILLVSSVKAAVQPVPSLANICSERICIRKNAQIKRDRLIEWLVKKGYHLSSLVEEKGDYAVRGGIVDFYCPTYPRPVRVEFFADKVESIREFDPATQRSVNYLDQVTLFPSNELDLVPQSTLKPFIQTLPGHFLLLLDEPLEVERELIKFGCEKNQNIIEKRATFYISTLPQRTEWMRPKREIFLESSPLSFYRGNLELLSRDINHWQQKGYNITILTSTSQQAKRLQELLQEKGFEFIFKESFDSRGRDVPFLITLGDIERGFIFEETGDVLISDTDIFKRYRQRKRKHTPFEEKITHWGELKEGDYVVHVDYGIGRFRGLVSLKVTDTWGDYFQVDYKGSDRLYVPFNQLDRLHKYVGDSDSPPPIYSLEGAGWELTKKRVREATRELAASLLELYSIRKTKSGYSFSPDTPWQLQFEASFPYEETPDQLTATEQVKKDMESPVPMDRLICGDSGYGKTEVAVRASFKAVMDNKQVAVLVPTTILADQHLRTFSERMADYPIRIEMLSRFQSSKRQKEIIEDLKEGKIDIVIGTHRLLQDDVNFKDLGLVIIDEEHRFGVVQKKKIKELKKTVDVLTLSATPIPRSLYMALTGIYELSTIFSPPQERQEVETEVAEYSDKIVKEAILQELTRKGQVFYLYNKVKTIHKVAGKLKEMFPEAKIAVAHGQMNSTKLEKTIIDFIKGRYDILVCTSIIESGIDMPHVNTLIVENSEQFGLADLYQLRGRVGRGRRKGYAYFLFTPEKVLTDQAKRRLQIIHQFKGAGAGLKIAMEDLQIRGAGNLLGKEQHGHIASVGFTLYSQLLAEEVKKLKGEKPEPSFPIHIELGVEARIPPSYVPCKAWRMQLYQKIGEIEGRQKLFEFEEELKDRFGPLPSATRNLIHVLNIKLLAKKIGICSISKNCNKMIKVSFSPFHPLSFEKKEKIKQKFPGSIKTFSQDERNLLITKPEGKNEEEFLIWLKDFLQKLKDVLI